MSDFTDMLSIESYVRTAEVVLVEAVKYFSLLLFSVLAIRLWKRQLKLSAAGRRSNLLLAIFFSLTTCCVGYFSMRHSLSLLYCHYGTRAFDAGNLSSADALFQRSAEFWKNADAVGGAGTVLLLMGKPEQGKTLLHEARIMRGGRNNPFEQFYEGLFYFFHEQPDQAIPLLEAASANVRYQWNVSRILSAIALEKNQPEDAERLMKPFVLVEVSDGDYSHAYVSASLCLLKGNKAEAEAILKRFPLDNLSSFWKPRFERLKLAATQK